MIVRLLAAAAAVLIVSPALAVDAKTGSVAKPAASDVTVTPEEVEKAVAAAWKNLPEDLAARVEQDETMKVCSLTRNQPSEAQAAAIMARERKTIVHPEGGSFMGDWKMGEKLSLSGYGGRMGDDPKRANGGNCYACHQLAPSEISYGTLGPSLLGYGKLKGHDLPAQKEVYERIYNAQSVYACSNMPRFGHNGFLTIDQIKDAVAFLLDPESPVNK
ncbi:Sulfur oxidation protein SoxX [Rhodovulum sp. PH10]|uniref:sulfur oxidation c-type cytochrome SoxX n=1 Tax=Rhodovulum sp. PH10 TaxID=1187851 RepID=UPI00027C2E97|nr:sulfur oxidation c-type cytochrome SoxX [Rhodovulum sp. PH10]EJW10472.1 Sulfur oxidation protein SoxX [Rhodovulum sp. PH10]